MENELSKEEQALFDAMNKGEEVADDGVEGAEEAKAAAAKVAEKAVAKDAPKDSVAKDEKQDMVPANALHEARTQNKELKKELEALKGVVANGDKKLQTFMESVSKKAEAGAPKFEDDPAGNLKAENVALKEQIAKITDRLETGDAASRQQQNINNFAALVRAKEVEFTKTNPDYDKAAEYVAAVWRDEFMEAGFDEDKVPQMVFQKGLAMTHQAVQKEKNPAEAIYKLAKRYGFGRYTKDDGKTDGKAAKNDGESKLKQIEKGQDAARVNGGGSGPEEFGIAALAQMDDSEIENLVKNPDWWAKNIRRSPLH